jgi:hypothetical protein
MPDEDLRYVSAVIVTSSGEPIEFTHEEGLSETDWRGFVQHQYRGATLQLGDRAVAATTLKTL